MRQKRIEVRLASWIGKQQSLKNEAKQIAEERLQRAQEITEAMAPGVAKENEAIMTEVLSLSFCTLKTFISLKFE